jgi:hypothetical protein
MLSFPYKHCPVKAKPENVAANIMGRPVLCRNPALLEAPHRSLYFGEAWFSVLRSSEMADDHYWRGFACDKHALITKQFASTLHPSLPRLLARLGICYRLGCKISV